MQMIAQLNLGNPHSKDIQLIDVLQILAAGVQFMFYYFATILLAVAVCIDCEALKQGVGLFKCNRTEDKFGLPKF